MPAEDGLRIDIRFATAADGPRCADIFLHGRRAAFSWQPEDRFGLDDYYDCVDGEEVLVAELDGTTRLVVGFVSVDASERFIHTLFIDPQWRGRGIGSALLREALTLLRGSAELACASRNAAARAFYEHNGWTPVPATETGGDAEPLVVYRKSAL
ncbi:acetyltransferase (plasmid) [Azospirillum argentinense]|uniref:Acetyltransferase n=1 Tax=Azospirillum argentinense TaxID=2970906 RepID=A0A2K1FWP9_9PROT|nr:GNAT family N-acetyltransferase [Azospirillum argentinense]AIB13374.1 acetyltransferase [Azospirillum argentinense]EZQ06292.1 acetyltransferase [Azospirillum argentinense]KAA1053644.1 acetyltransferase (putative) [Azospirillum argentinense]PNQ96967.1 N-acetyltransferase [Azospirillum argentinense]